MVELSGAGIAEAASRITSCYHPSGVALFIKWISCEGTAARDISCLVIIEYHCLIRIGWIDEMVNR